MKRSVNTDDLKISFGGHSDKGLKDENQDAFALKINRGMALELKGHLAVIADGVSSANCATKASQMSVCHFIEEYLATPDSWSVNKAAQTVIASLNDWLYSRQLVNTPQGQLEEWYSTFSALILKGNQAHIFHVGDCQIAKINDDGYQVLTQEHASPAGMLNRALGASNHLKIDVIKTELAANDLFILSCDGVYQFVKNKQIIEIISQQPDLEQASLQITQLAKSQGSKDNLTCLLVKIEQVPAQAFEQLINSRKQQVIAPPLNIGDKLDHYTVVENLQLSTRSHVYLAKDNQSDVLVVLKVPSPNFTDDSHYLNNFIKEG
ncbi:MAG: protein phosphatase 2C domain-containing protein, partial [Psychrobium sp.]|nr:protein phosphatase 2C domain-containing protein [Psychrobium sp.]